MAKYKKKPVIVNAQQYIPTRDNSLPNGVHPANIREEAHSPYVITAQGQRVYVEHGDWIIEEPDGRGFYPCKPDIFDDTYELVNE